MKKLIADDGMVYTNGETFGKEICLPDNADVSVWKMVDESESGKEPMKYSTLSIKRELAKIGAWDAARALLEASGYWDDYVLANYLSEQDEAFKAASAALVAQGVVTEAQLAELLPKCVWSAD